MSTQNDQPALAKYRPSIDGLRAIAVLFVVCFHAFPEILNGGFIGVDIFFVISGYLISGILIRGLDQKHFNFFEFYARRVRRIFPALCLVLISIFILSYFLLPSSGFREINKHIAGGAGFLSNFLLWGEAGYFDTSSSTKPLLHLWSLGIEEQFYILWPPFLYLLYKKRLSFFYAILSFTVFSFLLNLSISSQYKIADFYSPISRFWELSLGGLLAAYAYKKEGSISFFSKLLNALKIRKSQSSLQENGVAFLGLALLVLSASCFHKDDAYPGWRALMPTLGTALLLITSDKNWVQKRFLSHPILLFIGVISYPLYLWHWPLLSLMRIIEGGQIEGFTALAIVGFSIMLAFLTFQLIEKPIRFGKNKKQKTLLLSILMLFIGCLSFLAYLTGEKAHLSSQFLDQLVWNSWSDAACENKYHISPCQVNGGQPELMILGDSHSNHLYPGFALTAPKTLVLASGTCLPLKDIFLHVKINPQLNPCEKEDFLTANEQILKETPSIKTVLISARWRHVLTGEIRNKHEHELWGGVWLTSSVKGEENRNNSELVNLGLARTLYYLEALKLNIVFMRATPEIDRELEDYCKLLSDPAPKNCSFPRADIEAYRQDEDRMILFIKTQFPHLLIYDPVEDLCDQTNCYLMKNGVLLYRDNHHLSIDGSKYLALKVKAWLLEKGLLNQEIHP